MTPRVHEDTGDEDRIVIRGTSGRWICGVLAALFAYLLIDASVRAEWSTVFVALPWMCAILVACWMLLIRPCLVIAPSTLTVVNVFRTHTLPWRDIAELHVRYQLVITLAEGGEIRAWGSPTTHPQRDHTADRTTASSKRAFVGVVEAIEQARDVIGRHTDSARHRAVSFAWLPLLALVLATVLGLLSARVLI